MAYETSIDRERAISQHIAEHGPADYVRWMNAFSAFRNRVILELEKMRIPDEWLVRSSLAASRAWETQNPCPLSNDEIDQLRDDAAAELGV